MVNVGGVDLRKKIRITQLNNFMKCGWAIMPNVLQIHAVSVGMREGNSVYVLLSAALLSELIT
jgi:hypothetical protein